MSFTFEQKLFMLKHAAEAKEVELQKPPVEIKKMAPLPQRENKPVMQFKPAPQASQGSPLDMVAPAASATVVQKPKPIKDVPGVPSGPGGGRPLRK